MVTEPAVRRDDRRAVERAGRLAGALRSAAPALLGYALVRAVGVAVVALWGAQRGKSGIGRLSTFWDAPWYQAIAVHGYAGTTPVPGPYGPYQPYAFFPAYPAMIKVFDTVLPLRPNQAALLVAWVAALVAAWGIYAVGSHLYGHRVGVIAAVLWGVTPYAVVESAAYSEQLFTAFAAWTCYAALTRRWVWAGVLCMTAGLTRPTGIALAAAVSAAALWELVRRRGDWHTALGMVIAPLGFLGFLAWVGVVKGRWDGYFRVQDAWQSHFDFGRSTYHSLRDLLTQADQVWLTQVVVAAVLAGSVVLLVVSVLQRQPLVLVLFSAAMLVLALGDAAYFNSRARFLLPAFGLLLPVANGLVRVRSRSSLVLLLSSAALLSAAYGGYVVFVYPDAP
ncbi:glycosyltransferase family 39 protein [Kitasatospora sp. DSM 101779]|uniref:glycosyltransferase family 39 protein n=1 Tax=Kitasatospora sp. DSM 101779 TaxID=2853165 RepID=UPI0021D7F429|nr:glycosyltransferase family 39 protein [Kitasatospora sp. DSM 101779]MCU7824365.1 glycosyltransferase family 39 protein [Kitasatospora sp. DSM 101779]